MEIYLSHKSAIQFWLSARSHRERVGSRWSKNARLKTAPPDQSINMRCLLQYEYECVLGTMLAERDRPGEDVALGKHEARAKVAARNEAFEKYGLSPKGISFPTLLEVIESGPEAMWHVTMDEGHVPSISAIEAQRLSERYGLTLPLDASAVLARNRRKNSVVTTYRHPKNITFGAYVEVERGLFVASPELTLLQASTFLSTKEDFAELATLASEFFAVYVTDDSVKGNGLLRRQAVSSPAKCEAFLKKCSSCGRLPDGARTMEKAVRCAAFNNASPMEVVGALELKVKKSDGAFGLGKTLCNCKIDTSRAFRDAKDHYRLVDVYLPESRLAIEYYGDNAHGDMQKEHDAVRATELASVGVTVIVAQRSDFLKFESLDRFMIDVVSRRARKYDSREFARNADKRPAFYRGVLRALRHTRWFG